MTTKGAKHILHYWPSIPGRGEFVRLAFESTCHPYTEKNTPMNIVMKANKSIGHPPHFACPILEVVDESSSSSSSSAYISQTSAILAYLAPQLNLDGGASSLDGTAAASIRRAHVNQITLTILDLNNEVHDVHHPVSGSLTYEEQLEESGKRAADFRKNRIPKYFQLFHNTLETNPESKEWLISAQFSTADLALFQVVDGLHFAFPRLMGALKAGGKYDLVFGLRDRVAAIDTVSAYLKSSRRKEYSNGIFRHYPELDGEE